LTLNNLLIPKSPDLNEIMALKKRQIVKTGKKYYPKKGQTGGNTSLAWEKKERKETNLCHFNGIRGSEGRPSS